MNKPRLVLSRPNGILTGVAFLLLVLLTLAFFRHIALSNQILSGVDAFTYFYPYRAYVAETIRSGRLPLWNPYLFLGAPGLANSQAGVFYPLNLALSWLSAPKIVAWSIVLHVALGAALAYLYARRAARLSPLAAFLAASVFAFGGFLSGQVEHVNQLSVSAWFPLLLLLWEIGSTARARGVRWRAWLGIAAVIGIGLLAGHSQASYISVVGLGVYALVPLVPAIGQALRKRSAWKPALRALGQVALVLGLVGLVALVLAAVQLLPTMELSRLSIRGEGLSYREAVAFSLKPLPRLLRYTFLPPWGGNLADIFGGDFYTEYLAYVGILPLLLAALAAISWVKRLRTELSHRPREKQSPADTDSPPVAATSLSRPAFRVESSTSTSVRIPAQLLVLAGTGLFLALGAYNPFYFVLYKVMPGFDLFRVPARWLFLYAFGAAMLAGIGLQQVMDGLYRRLAGRTGRDSDVAATGATPGRDRTGRDSDVAATGATPGRNRTGRDSDVATTGATPGRDSDVAATGGRGRVVMMAGSLVVIVALAELFVAALPLPFNHPTAPQAFSSLRTAPAHILAAQQLEIAPGRFLSMSDMTFDPGDRGDIEHMFRGALDERAIYDYIVCMKRQEILAPNLPLARGIYAVDGYDGGLLPLARYVYLQRLFLDEQKILPDGRLREGLERIPPSRLLSILGVRYVITDKVHDVWIDDVFYDLAFDAALGQDASPTVATEAIPHLAANELGVVSYLEGAQDLADGTPVAEIHLTTEQGEVRSLTLRAGQDTAEGLYTPGVKHTQARIGHSWRDQPEGSDYVSRIGWEKPLSIRRIEIVALPSAGRVHIRGLALVDTRDGSNVPVLLSTDGQYRQVHSGDVKVYEVVDALPRAYIVHHTQVTASDEAALAVMQDPGFDPTRVAILAGGQVLDESPSQAAQVTITRYEPEGVAVSASLQAPGYLILDDSWYPGWKATVDGQPAPIERANIAFRAVYLSPGTHTVEFVYRPAPFWVGLGLSLAGWLGAVAGFAVLAWRRSSKSY